MGYVVKAEAATELLAAVEAVCQGRQFVTPELPLAPRLNGLLCSRRRRATFRQSTQLGLWNNEFRDHPTV